MDNRLKIILIPVLVVVLLGISGAGVYLYLQSQQQPVTEEPIEVPEPGEEPTEVTPIDREQIFSEENIEKNKEFSKLMSRAIAEKNSNYCYDIISEVDRQACLDIFSQQFILESDEKTVAICQSLVDEQEKDLCFYDAAVEQKNASICDNIISAEVKSVCQSDTLIQLAIAQKDITLCSRLSEQFLENCIDFLVLRLRDIQECDKLSDYSRDYCQYSTARVEVEINNDTSFCDQVENQSLRLDCGFEYFLVEDSDNDGLNDYDEIFYQTDKNNPDSDGDGYMDGDEVSNGYNPLGEGRL